MPLGKLGKFIMGKSFASAAAIVCINPISFMSWSLVHHCLEFKHEESICVRPIETKTARNKQQIEPFVQFSSSTKPDRAARRKWQWQKIVNARATITKWMHVICNYFVRWTSQMSVISQAHLHEIKIAYDGDDDGGNRQNRNCHILNETILKWRWVSCHAHTLKWNITAI